MRPHRLSAPAAMALAALAALVGGCASHPRTDAEAPAAPLVSLNGLSGTPAAPDDIAAAAAAADVLILGENHSHPAGLAFAADIFDRVLERCPRASLSLEFFTRDQQAALDDYLAGLTEEEAFRKAAARTPGNYPEGHRRMVEAARKAARPVHASNAPRQYTRVANKEGFDRLQALTAEQRRLYTVPLRLPEGRYRDDFFDQMESMPSHTAPPPKRPKKGAPPPPPPPPTPEEIEGMFRAQSVWDWTMAQSIARALDAGERPVVHVVGRFHSDFRGGLVEALEHLRPGTRVVTVSFVAERAEALAEDDRQRADFVVYAGPAGP